MNGKRGFCIVDFPCMEAVLDRIAHHYITVILGFDAARQLGYYTFMVYDSSTSTARRRNLKLSRTFT